MTYSDVKTQSTTGIDATMKTIIVLIALVLLSGCSKKTEFDYSLAASNFLQANEKQSAEAILKEGLLKYPQSTLLKSDLFVYYMKTNQWNVVEEYYQTAGAGFSGGEHIISAIAEHFFETKDWEKAYKYYMASGRFRVYESLEKSECAGVSIEEYRNAAAAALNMLDA